MQPGLRSANAAPVLIAFDVDRICGDYFYGSYDTPPFDAQTLQIHCGVCFRLVEPARPMAFPESALVG